MEGEFSVADETYRYYIPYLIFGPQEIPSGGFAFSTLTSPLNNQEAIERTIKRLEKELLPRKIVILTWKRID